MYPTIHKRCNATTFMSIYNNFINQNLSNVKFFRILYYFHLAYNAATSFVPGNNRCRSHEGEDKWCVIKFPAASQ